METKLFIMVLNIRPLIGRKAIFHQTVAFGNLLDLAEKNELNNYCYNLKLVLIFLYDLFM